jgi:hypothetical protein
MHSETAKLACHFAVAKALQFRCSGDFSRYLVQKAPIQMTAFFNFECTTEQNKKCNFGFYFRVFHTMNVSDRHEGVI